MPTATAKSLFELDAGRTAIELGVMITGSCWVALFFSFGFVEAARYVAVLLLATLLTTWLLRSAKNVPLAFAVLFARIATVFFSTVYVEPYYIAHTGLDAEMYHTLGIEISHSPLLKGSLPGLVQTWGTNNYAIVTGMLYSLFGASQMIIKLINSCVGGIGSFLFYNSFASHYGKRSRLLPFLILFWPSTLYWSSIHGKDPWVYFFLALGFWAVSKLFCGGSVRLFCVYFLASVGVFVLRPHVALVYLGAAAIVFVIRSLRSGRTNALLKWCSVFSLAALVVVVIFVANTYTGIQYLSTDDIPSQLSDQLSGLATGGTAIEVPHLLSLTGLLAHLPDQIITFMFRPFPWEGSNLYVWLAGLNQVGLAVALLLISLYLVLGLLDLYKKGTNLSPRWAANSLTLFLVIYCIGFILLFSLISANLGTLARQRIQLEPFAWCCAFALATPDRVRHKTR